MAIYFAVFIGAVTGWFLCAMFTASKIDELEAEIDRLREGP